VSLSEAPPKSYASRHLTHRLREVAHVPKSDKLIFHCENVQAKIETQWRKHKNQLKEDLHLALVMMMMESTKHDWQCPLTVIT
jgi:Ser-tRNA(Ala) deacylase AlaX